MKLGGLTIGSIRNRDEARQRAELLRPVLAELAGMTARAIARELNEPRSRCPAADRGMCTTTSEGRPVGVERRPLKSLSTRLSFEAQCGGFCLWDHIMVVEPPSKSGMSSDLGVPDA